MTRRTCFFLIFLGLLAGGACTAAPAQAKPHRVVVALTSPEAPDWELTVGNLRNLIKGLPSDSLDVELVAYGPGLTFLKKGSSAQAAIEALETQHVHFAACENSMRALHVSPADLIPGVGPVPSGIVEVVTKEEAGWSYIKAGR